MNNYYALIYLTEHINDNLENATYRFSISPHRNVWEGYFEQPDGEQIRLVFSTTPGETTIFTDRYRAPKKSNVIRFFDTLSEEKAEKVSLSEGDRLLSIQFQGSKRLLFQLFGNKSNLYLVQNNRITDAFKNTSDVTGNPPPQPRKPGESGLPPENVSTKKQLLYVDQKLPRHLIEPIIRHYHLEEAEPGRIQAVVGKLVKAMEENPEFRVLTTGKLCLIPHSLLPHPDQKVFNHINEAVRFCYYRASRLRRFDSRMKSLRPELDKALRKSEKSLRQLEDAERALERAEQYEAWGHLLMAHAHEERDPASSSIKVADFYNNDRIIEIELKDQRSIADNAQYYYERSTKAKRRVKESRRREKEIQMTLQQLERLLDSLHHVKDLNDLEEWEKEHRGELEDLGLITGKKQKVSSPWRKTEADPYEIWIGKNAKSNDKLTSEADKEDIWLHARGTSGSHVVIRMQNNKEFPPRHVIRKAASHAAYHSGLRGSSLVPVIVTKRKYVTKPKGAPAGTVRVQREEVEMVAPKKE